MWNIFIINYHCMIFYNASSLYDFLKQSPFKELSTSFMGLQNPWSYFHFDHLLAIVPFPVLPLSPTYQMKLGISYQVLDYNHPLIYPMFNLLSPRWLLIMKITNATLTELKESRKKMQIVRKQSIIGTIKQKILWRINQTKNSKKP